MSSLPFKASPTVDETYGLLFLDFPENYHDDDDNGLEYVEGDYVILYEIFTGKIEKINKGVLKNIYEKVEFSKNHKNKLEPFVKKAYDLYLKKNNQSHGIKSYGLVVNLLIYDYQSKIKLSSSPSIWFLSLLNSKLNSFNILSNSVIKYLALFKLDICIEVGP